MTASEIERIAVLETEVRLTREMLKSIDEKVDRLLESRSNKGNLILSVTIPAIVALLVVILSHALGK